MVNAVSSVSAAPLSAYPTARAVAVTANNTLIRLLKSDDVVQALAGQSSFYLLPNTGQVMATLWALFNINSTPSITQDDVQRAVVSEGGSRSDGSALWKQLNINNKSTVSAGDFAYGYLTLALPSKMADVQDAVKQVLLQQGPSTTSNMLSTFVAGGGTGSLITGAYDSGIFV